MNSIAEHPKWQARPWAEQAEQMVKHQIQARGIVNTEVLRAMATVPRHLFVPANVVNNAYDDGPLQIGHDQTISQPFIVALMSELLGPIRGKKVLEIGTGCGYQSAVLAELGANVYSVELVAELAADAKARLNQLGYHNVHVQHGDGYQGWPEHAPYDAIVCAAAPKQIPETLKQQLADGGRLVLPVGEQQQELVTLERHGDSFRETKHIPVRFVPMLSRSLPA